MSPRDESDNVAALLERLLTDGAFRREFRRDPVSVSRAGGLVSLADELEETSGRALETLEVRESKSSLAGVMMAAAAEGVGAVELLRYLHAQQSLPPEIAAPVHKALTSPKLLAVAPAPVPNLIDSAPPPAAPVPPADAVPAPPSPEAVAPAAVPETGVPAPPVADHVVPAATPEVPSPAAAPVHEAVAGVPAPPAEPAAAPSGPADQLLHDPHVHLTAEAQQDLAAGAGDERFVSALSTLTAQHDVGISAIKDGAIDISSVDGEPVGATNVAARELVVALGQLDPSLRPAQIGSPWPIDGPGFVTGAGYEDHIHVAFDAAASGQPAATSGPAATGVVASVPASQQAVPAPSSTLHGTPAADPAQHVDATPVADAATALPDVSDAYPGDSAPKEEIAAWMARQAHKAGLPGELPVMASLVESGMTNVQGGDRDSVGFFQMRTGIWDEGPYRNFQNHPELQLRWFIDHALAVKRERLASGDRSFLHDSSKWGDWIADVERPAEQYRGRYQLRLDEAQGLLHSAGPAPSALAEHAVDQLPAVQTDPSRIRELAAMAVAKKYLGTPYQWGGVSPSTGFDCSGLMQYAYHQAGVDLPRVSEDQIGVGIHLTRSQLEPGDLVFFQDSTGDVHHVGMYIGGGKFLHAPHTGDVVKISNLSEPYYQEQFAGGRSVGGLAAAGAPIPNLPGVHLAPDASPAPTAAAAADPAAAAPVAPAADAAAQQQPVGTISLKAAAEPAAAAPRSTVQFLSAVDPHAQQQPAAIVPRPPLHFAEGHPPATPDPADVAAAAPVGVDAYPGDGAPRAQIAAWMGTEAEKAGLPRELPVMASLVESGMTNIQGGDRDSVGFFQMRTGIWDEGPYRNFEQHPELQLKWFIDQAVAVRDQRLNEGGDNAFVTDPSKWGDWIADVERPAEEYRGRYQLRLDEAQQLLGSPQS